MDQGNALRQVALASAALLAVLCALTFVTGVSQQAFEWVMAPDVYGRALLRDHAMLRVLIATDDVFIAAYTSMAVLFAAHLRATRPSPLYVLAGVFVVVAGVLDLEENHHLLALLRLAETGALVPLDEILRRSDLSQLKWMLGHVAFALIGLALPAERTEQKVFRASLLYVQLPLGALTWVVPGGALLATLVWLRYFALLSGFLMVARLSARPRAPALSDDGAIGSGAPA
jgi:hypothetical protein